MIINYHKKLKGISFSNNNGIQDQHLGIGDGSIDYAELILAIHQTQWSGLVAFETRNQSTEQGLQELINLHQAIRDVALV